MKRSGLVVPFALLLTFSCGPAAAPVASPGPSGAPTSEAKPAPLPPPTAVSDGLPDDVFAIVTVPNLEAFVQRAAGAENEPDGQAAIFLARSMLGDAAKVIDSRAPVTALVRANRGRPELVFAFTPTQAAMNEAGEGAELDAGKLLCQRWEQGAAAKILCAKDARAIRDSADVVRREAQKASQGEASQHGAHIFVPAAAVQVAALLLFGDDDGSEPERFLFKQAADLAESFGGLTLTLDADDKGARATLDAKFLKFAAPAPRALTSSYMDGAPLGQSGVKELLERLPSDAVAAWGSRGGKAEDFAPLRRDAIKGFADVLTHRRPEAEPLLAILEKGIFQGGPHAFAWSVDEAKFSRIMAATPQGKAPTEANESALRRASLGCLIAVFDDPNGAAFQAAKDGAALALSISNTKLVSQPNHPALGKDQVHFSEPSSAYSPAHGFITHAGNYTFGVMGDDVEFAVAKMKQLMTKTRETLGTKQKTLMAEITPSQRSFAFALPRGASYFTRGDALHRWFARLPNMGDVPLKFSDSVIPSGTERTVHWTLDAPRGLINNILHLIHAKQGKGPLADKVKNPGKGREQVVRGRKF
jgi:hypothetical protein